MQDNNPQNSNNNQASFPQTTDMPPMPSPVVPESLKPLETPPQSFVPDSTPLNNPSPVMAPDLPVTNNVPPTVVVELPNKKSPLVTISLVLLLIAALAVAVYFGSKVFLNKESEVMPEETPFEEVMEETVVEPTDSMMQEEATMPAETVMPASDNQDLIPTLPEATP